MERPHKKLEVWKKSLDLVEDIYRISNNFPDQEKFTLVSQVRRSSISIPSNIAEGAARFSKAEFMRFLHYALGSCSELDTQLEISKRLGYIDAVSFDSVNQKLIEINAMLLGLRNSLKNEN